MKILVYGLSNNIGGVESIVLSIISRLSDRCSFDLLISGECTYKDSLKNVNFLNIVSWGSNPSLFGKELADILLSSEYKCVWINGCIMANRTIISVIKKYSTAIILTHSHGTYFEEMNPIKSFILKGLHYLNRNYYLRNIDIPCACSMKSAEWYYGKKYCKNASIHVINNGVDVSKYYFKPELREQVRTELCLGNSLVLFHAGRLTLVKNQKKIINIVKAFVDKGKNVKLLIAGVGELEAELKEYVVNLNLISNVEFLGFRKDINRLCQAADAFILPSFHEGLPVTIIEAQATGLSCFISDTITKEADVSGLVHFLPLAKSDEQWAEVIEDNTNLVGRELAATAIVKHRYDIESVANDLYNLILSKAN